MEVNTLFFIICAALIFNLFSFTVYDYIMEYLILINSNIWIQFKTVI